MEYISPQPIETAPQDGSRVYISGGRYSDDSQTHGMAHEGPSLAVYCEALNPEVDPPWLLIKPPYYIRIKDPSHWTPL